MRGVPVNVLVAFLSREHAKEFAASQDYDSDAPKSTQELTDSSEDNLIHRVLESNDMLVDSFVDNLVGNLFDRAHTFFYPADLDNTTIGKSGDPAARRCRKSTAMHVLAQCSSSCEELLALASKVSGRRLRFVSPRARLVGTGTRTLDHHLCALQPAMRTHWRISSARATKTILRTPLHTTNVESATTATTQRLQADDARSSRTVRRAELKKWREYEQFRGGLDPVKLTTFFLQRPLLIAARLVEIARKLNAAQRDWDASAPGEGRGDRLCDTISSLGPVAVKVAQTLSQRSDLVGNEAAAALKRLQTANAPFDNDLAWAIIKESLNWRGPIAPGVGVSDDDCPEVQPLFAEISEKPVAAASLGQVYKASTHKGVEIAVKVQRPDAIATLAKDYMCFVLVWYLIEAYWRIIGNFDSGDIRSVVDTVATQIYDEMDYDKEAQNAARFEESLRFLGFVTTPQKVPEFSAGRVLVTEWVQGQHLNTLPPEQGLLMTRMAVEATTASMLLTGYVHADPHEGNLMLANDGRLVFLDFGLMSTVNPLIMEAFARGIQACLAKDWYNVAQTFKETGFVNDPIQYRPNAKVNFEAIGTDEKTGEDLGLAKFTTELAKAMTETEGGTSRFGALAEILNLKLSLNWKMFTPPYVLLLIRTYLTLEGIAARVDPNFNIYQVAMPWAVRRSLSPSSPEGKHALRTTFLTGDNRVNWGRLQLLMSEWAKAEEESNNESAMKANATVPIELSSETKIAKAAAMNEAVNALLGSPSGITLRRVLHDLDSTDLMQQLLSPKARQLRLVAALALCDRICSWWKTLTAGAQDVAQPLCDLKLQQRRERWKRKVIKILIQVHLSRQLQRGSRGAVFLIQLAYLSVKLAVSALWQALMRGASAFFGSSVGAQKLAPSGQTGGGSANSTWKEKPILCF